MQLVTLQHLNRLRNARISAVLVTRLADGEAYVVAEGETPPSPASTTAIFEVLHSGRARISEIGGERHFINAYLPPPRLVIVGAVHISQSLAPMALLSGFDVRIIDPRTAFAASDRFSGIDVTPDWPADAFVDHPLDAHTAVVALTHDPKIDDFPIAHALACRCFYVGALGSRKTHDSRLKRLKAGGLTDVDLAQINGPIGLDIGAIGPAEIAVAILAQIIAKLRTTDTASLTGVRY